MNTKTQAAVFAVISQNMRADYAGISPDVRNYWQPPFSAFHHFASSSVNMSLNVLYLLPKRSCNVLSNRLLIFII